MWKVNKENGCKLPEKSSTGRTYLQWTVAITANLSLLTYGLQAGWVSPTIKTFLSEDSPTGNILTDNEISWIASILVLSASAAGPFFTYISDVYGRKTAILVISAMQAMGWLIKLVYSVNTVAIIAARAFCGMAAGGCFIVNPMYIKEISQDDIRGKVGSLLIMFQNIGFFIIFAIGAYLNYYTVLYIVLWLPILAIVLMFFAPESPAFLMKVGRVEEATKVIAQLRRLHPDHDVVQKEMDTMKKEDLLFKSIPDVSFRVIFKEEAWRKSFFLMITLITFHASAGTFALVTFASTILSFSSTKFNPELQSLSFPAVMILTAFVSMNCVERFGRKPLLAVSFTLLALSKLCIGAVILIQNKGGTVLWWIPLAAMMINVSAYAFGISPVPFVMLSEIFNFQIRAKVVGTIVSYSWLLSFVQVFIFNPLTAYIGLHGVFFFFAIINIIGLIFTISKLPETKGKSVEQIEMELRTKK